MVLVIGEGRHQGRESNWSNLYFDYAVNDWLMSVTEPVNTADTHVISVGHDILLHELIDRTISNRLEGTYNLIFHEDGRLIAHPRFMDAIQARSGDLPIPEAGDPNLLRIFNLVKRQSDRAIIDNNEDKEYLAVTHLQGPGWYLATVFPKALIARQAFGTARLILILGAAALLLEISILFFVLRKQVAEPLTSLMEATNRVAAGDFDVQLDEHRGDEIGRLARSLNIMSREINAREIALNERRNALLRAQQEAAIDGILVVDEHQQVMSYNRRFIEMWRIPDTLLQSHDDKAWLDFVMSQVQGPEQFIAKVESSTSSIKSALTGPLKKAPDWGLRSVSDWSA